MNSRVITEIEVYNLQFDNIFPRVARLTTGSRRVTVAVAVTVTGGYRDGKP